MKLFDTAKTRAWDAYTLAESGISAHSLMERAAGRCLDWIQARYDRSRPFLIVCGMGNNGGDGLALCRLMHRAGFSAQALYVRHRERPSDDAATNLEALRELDEGLLLYWDEGAEIIPLDASAIVVEALLGTGLDRPVTGFLAHCIDTMNQWPQEKIAIDIPAGMRADFLPANGDIVFKADHTLSFQLPKRTFLHEESLPYTGEWHILDIGLSAVFLRATHSHDFLIDDALIAGLYRPRQRFGHKGTYGKACLVGGSYGKIGAIALASKAALRAGAGIVIAHAPRCGYGVLQSLCPEALFQGDGDQALERFDLPMEGACLGIGPGMGMGAETGEGFLRFLARYDLPLVLDADALNLVSGETEGLHLLPPGSVITPHPKEWERLAGKAPNSMEAVEQARAKAMKHNITIVLKGGHTTVLCPSGKAYYNLSGNPGMATGGSGDVLTGIITALMAQKYAPEAAALLGVYLHAMAGDRAAAELGQEGLLASDLIAHLSKAFQYVARLPRTGPKEEEG